jgi:hypothetical protein
VKRKGGKAEKKEQTANNTEVEWKQGKQIKTTKGRERIQKETN